jgi:hypothetical protein
VRTDHHPVLKFALVAASRRFSCPRFFCVAPLAAYRMKMLYGKESYYNAFPDEPASPAAE